MASIEQDLSLLETNIYSMYGTYNLVLNRVQFMHSQSFLEREIQL